MVRYTGDSIESKSITLLNNASRMLAEVQTIDDAKNLMDMASAAEHYARKHGLGKEAIAFAHSIEISAEIKLGEILIEMEKHPPGPDKQDRSSMLTDPPTRFIRARTGMTTENQVSAMKT